MINNSASVFGNGPTAAGVNNVNNSDEVMMSADGINHFHFILRVLLSEVVVFSHVVASLSSWSLRSLLFDIIIICASLMKLLLTTLVEHLRFKFSTYSAAYKCFWHWHWHWHVARPICAGQHNMGLDPCRNGSILTISSTAGQNCIPGFWTDFRFWTSQTHQDELRAFVTQPICQGGLSPVWDGCFITVTAYFFIQELRCLWSTNTH